MGREEAGISSRTFNFVQRKYLLILVRPCAHARTPCRRRLSAANPSPFCQNISCRAELVCRALEWVYWTTDSARLRRIATVHCVCEMRPIPLAHKLDAGHGLLGACLVEAVGAINARRAGGCRVVQCRIVPQSSCRGSLRASGSVPHRHGLWPLACDSRRRPLAFSRGCPRGGTRRDFATKPKKFVF